MSPLVARALEIARGEVGTREHGKNAGPRVEQYLASVGQKAGMPWCAAFVHYCMEKAAHEQGQLNPCPRSAGVLRLWRQAAGFQVLQPKKGCVFIHDAGKGLGHTGFITEVLWLEMRLLTIEGNTNVEGSREGDSVAVKSRPFEYVNCGYLDFGPDGDQAVG